MTRHANPPGIPLPVRWSQCTNSAMLHIIALAQFALSHARGWAVNSPIARVRQKDEDERLRPQVAWHKEEIRINHARMERIDPQKRPIPFLSHRPRRAVVSSPQKDRITFGMSI